MLPYKLTSNSFSQHKIRFRLNSCLISPVPLTLHRKRVPNYKHVARAEAETSSSDRQSVNVVPESSQGNGVVVKRRQKPWITVERSLMLLAGLKILVSYLYGNPTPPASIRTIAGRYAWFLQIPIGLALCFLAKKIVDWRVHERLLFLPALVVGLIAAHLYIPYLIFRPGPGMKMLRVLEARERRIMNPAERRLRKLHRNLQLRNEMRAAAADGERRRMDSYVAAGAAAFDAAVPPSSASQTAVAFENAALDLTYGAGALSTGRGAVRRP